MRKVISALLAGAMVASMSVATLAANPSTLGTFYDEDGVAANTLSDGSTLNFTSKAIVADPARPNGTYFMSMGATSATDVAANYNKDASITALLLSDLLDDDNFKFKVDKDEGAKYIKKISVVDDKVLGSWDRTGYLKIELNDSTTTSELKSTGEITFTARKAKLAGLAPGEVAGGKAGTASVWSAGDKVTIPYTLWINNKEVPGEDGEADTGDRVYFKPTSNEDNTMIWGDDRAGLFFEGNDDTSKFYARLSTKSDSDIYSEYGDPVNADLWFYDFVGSAAIPSTSRATVTLGIPWDEDDDYVPNPEDCFIYEKDADGMLTDVTSQFTYSEDNEGTTGIEGWSKKTRTLGCYIISDTELDTAVLDVDEPTDEPTDVEEPTSSTVSGGKDIPNTGSSDMVGVATVAAIVSLAAAGAVAFKKASK